MSNYNDIFNFIVYDTLNASHFESNVGIMENVAMLEKPQSLDVQFPAQVSDTCKGSVGVVGRKKRRRRPKVCKNKEEAETQRMTHIAVERNRRKQMNEHLAVLRSLMPESYCQRGDQASVVGGAIDYVKELEHLVHSLEAQKMLIQQRSMGLGTPEDGTSFLTPLFPDSNRQGNKYSLKSRTSLAEVEVTLVETHANLRIFTKKNPRHLSKLVSGFLSLRFTILHLNVTTLDPLVLYSISVKVEEGCQLTSVDSIAYAVQQVLRIIDEDVSNLLLTY
ncbi:transcription factor bHLH94-like [Silene latifolia]|uniref:transcription factor bHLH94-like n=1 Tax=Silene latifolia TaxID=37657 RepID=UPI003D76FAD4